MLVNIPYMEHMGMFTNFGVFFWDLFFFFRSQVDVAKNQQLASQQGIRFLAPLAPLYADLMRI